MWVDEEEDTLDFNHTPEKHSPKPPVKSLKSHIGSTKPRPSQVGIGSKPQSNFWGVFGMFGGDGKKQTGLKSRVGKC